MMRQPPTGYKVVTKSKATGLILNQIRNLVTLRQQETSKQNPGLRSLPSKAKSLYEDRCIYLVSYHFLSLHFLPLKLTISQEKLKQQTQYERLLIYACKEECAGTQIASTEAADKLESGRVLVTDIRMHSNSSL